MLNLANYLEDIYEHFDAEYPREGCGLLGVLKGKLYWLPCSNIAKDSEEFILDSSEFFRFKLQYDIVGIVHSHPDAPSTPSEHDVASCNALGIPYYIFSFPSMNLDIVQPTTNITDLMGRAYQFGIADCFEASRDWYGQQGINLPHREPFEDDWWLKGLNYFTEERINTWGFQKVEEPVKGDLLIFTMGAAVPNHCGVFLGNDIFYHHAQNRLSCRENLYPFWIKYLTGIYRYAT